MSKFNVLRAGLFGAAFFISAAGAAWEVAFEAPQYTMLSDLDMGPRGIGYCVGYENRDAGGGPD